MNLLKDSGKAADVFTLVVDKLCIAVDMLDLRLPASFRDAQFAEAHEKLNEAISLFEDLQYSASMTFECEKEKEADERAEYERLKAKFGA